MTPQEGTRCRVWIKLLVSMSRCLSRSESENMVPCLPTCAAYTCVFCGDWVTQSNPCPPFWTSAPKPTTWLFVSPGSTQATKISSRWRSEWSSRASPEKKTAAADKVLIRSNKDRASGLSGLVQCFCFVCSAYHGHVSSLIDISPYKFHQLSDVEQNQFVHVVSAFSRACTLLKRHESTCTTGFWQATGCPLLSMHRETSWVCFWITKLKAWSLKQPNSLLTRREFACFCHQTTGLVTVVLKLPEALAILVLYML